jgi:very-short-patch-repair endonuclease
MPDGTEDRKRVEQVMRFLAEVARRRSPVTRRWAAYDWTLDLATLPQHPSVRLGEEADDGAVVLTIRRPKETPCETPPKLIADWVVPGWQSPDAEPQVLTSRNVVTNGETVTLDFATDPQRVAVLENWKAKRAKWAAAELPVRRVIALFQRLFELRGRLERESERLALYAGDGMFAWHHPSGTIEHPLLLQRLELKFEPKTPSFELRFTHDPIELNTPLLRELSVDGRALSQIRERLSSMDFALFDAKASDYCNEVVHRLFSDGTWHEQRPSDKAENPRAFRHRVVMLTPRTGGIVNAIDGFIERLNRAEEIPEPLRSIVVGDSGEDVGDDEPAKGHSSEIDEGTSRLRARRLRPPVGEVDLLLTKPANPEQEAVVNALAQRGKVVVQGPPGTGKSHTIANLLGHLLAEGKSVLVTSHSTKALRVLREKVAPDLQPLCVSVLDRDSESQQLLENSVKGIIAGLQRPRQERKAEAERSYRARTVLLEQLKARETELRQAIRDEYDDLIVGGQTFPPSTAARLVREQGQLHEWLPGPLEPGVLCPLTDDEVRELYRLSTEITQQDETDIAAGLPTSSEVIRPGELEKGVSAIREFETKAHDPRTILWSDESSLSASDLRAAHSLGAKIVKDIRGASTLVLECMDAGRHGGPRREPWDDLVQTVERVAIGIDQHNSAVVKHSPAIHPRWPRTHALRVLEDIIEHMKAAGRLSVWSRIRRPLWLGMQRSTSVRGVPPATPEEFVAVRALILRDRDREDLIRRWSFQVAVLSQQSHGNLGSKPEDVARSHMVAIRQALEWHVSIWCDFEARLRAIGFRWEVAKELVPPKADQGDLQRWAEVIEKVCLPSLEARRHRAEARRVMDQLTSIQESLAKYPDKSVARALAFAIGARDLQTYTAAFRRYAKLIDLSKSSTRRSDLLAQLASTAPSWAQMIQGRVGHHHCASPPSAPSAAWLWRQLHQELVRRAKTDVNALQRAVSESKDRLQAETARYVGARVWERQHERAVGSVKAALFTWLTTVSQRGYQSGLRSERLKAEARRLLNEARKAVPAWIMPLARVVESYDFRVAQFDVVILDEASQCDMTGLVAMGIAKAAIIVGDDKQVSPMAVGERVLEMQTLIDEFLDGVQMKHLYTGRLSMYDLASAGFGQIIRLVEHFRCVNEIIQFSNHLSYEGEIKPLRESSSVPTRPFVVSHRVGGGQRDFHVNEVEALEIVSLMVAMLERPEYAGKSFGVISMLGEDQAMLVDRLLRERISEQVYASRNILCGIAPQFQGDERDVVLLSLVDNAADGPLRTRTDDDSRKRYNVAASRARDQLWVVHSLNPETDLKEGDLRRRLIKHAEDPLATERQLQEQTQKVESEFERLVLRSLTSSGYRVETQWKVGAFRIDMIVIGANNKTVAVECDGDRYHPPEDLDRDLDRQRMLERLGWRFVRIRGSEYFRDPDSSMTRVRRRMGELGVEPIGAKAAPPATTSSLHGDIVRRAEGLRREWAPEEPNADYVTDPELEVTSKSVDERGTDSSEKVLAIIREAGIPIGRSEIIERSGIPVERWNETIRYLVGTRAVARHGSKRGTRYALVSEAEEHLFEAP